MLDAGNTVIVVEHDMHIVAPSDWVTDMRPGAGSEGEKIVIAGDRFSRQQAKPDSRIFKTISA